MNLSDAIENHYTRLWQEPDRRAYFRAHDGEIDILKWDAAKTGLGVTLYATIGSSAHALYADAPAHRAEFFTGLKPERDDVARSLADLALFAVTENKALDHGHTVSMGEPLWDGTEMSAFLVMRQVQELVPSMHLPDGTHVSFMQATPLFEEERLFKARHGAEALMDRFEQDAVPFWNPDRGPAPID